MKIIVIVGDHPRNLSLLNKLYENDKVIIIGLILYKKDQFIPKPDNELPDDLINLWNLHFKKRYLSEKKFFNLNINIKKKISNILYVNEFKEFHTKKTLDFIKSINSEACFIFGAPVIKDPILSALPENTINLHLGLIPHYRGSVTVFWPFYFLEPFMVGTTYHIIDKFVDAGEIIHQNRPKLEYGDSMHDVACKSVVTALKDLDIVVTEIMKRVNLKIKTKSNVSLNYKSKLYKKSDWKPEMLKKIYEVYDDKIVDLYLDKKIKCSKTKLVKIDYFMLNENRESIV